MASLGWATSIQFNDALSRALIIEQPFGADVTYQPRPPMTADRSSLGGTTARVDSTTVTALMRYKLPNNFSVHGGFAARAPMPK